MSLAMRKNVATKCRGAQGSKTDSECDILATGNGITNDKFNVEFSIHVTTYIGTEDFGSRDRYILEKKEGTFSIQTHRNKS